MNMKSDHTQKITEQDVMTGTVPAWDDWITWQDQQLQSLV